MTGSGNAGLACLAKLRTENLLVLLTVVALVVIRASCLVGDAPQQFQPSTLNTALVACNYQTRLNATSSSFALCPTNTCHVVVNRSVSWIAAEAGTTWTANFSIGCCPNKTYGVYDSTDNRLYGCCGEQDLPGIGLGAPIPCFNYQRQLIGCTNTATRCCGDRICGKNYVCCGGQCCPDNTGPLTGLYSLDQACDSTTVRDSQGKETVYYSGCKDPASLFICEPLINYTVTCPPYNASSEVNECPYCEINVTSCTFPPPNSSFLQLPCGASSDCVKMDAIIVNCSTITSPCTDNVSVVDIPVGCTNKTHPPSEVCLYNLDGPIPSLVGDRAPDETCCGPFICSTGMKCCSQDVTTFLNSTGTNSTVTQFYGCCPDVADIECCYNNVMDSTDSNNALNFFCGAAYNSTSCRVDKMRSPLFFAMAQLARNYTIT